MNKREKEDLKRENAITLIALVITIIIIVVISAVSINIALGENKIVSRTKQAEKEYKEAKMREELDLLMAYIKIETIGNLTKTELKQVLNENGYEIEEDIGLIVSDKYPNLAMLIDLDDYKLGDIIYLDDVTSKITLAANNYKDEQELNELVGSVQITIKVSEIKNGFQSIELLKDGVVLIRETNKKTYKKVLTVIENGTYTLKTKANVTGEEKIEQIVITKIDTSIPTVEITQNPTSETYAKKVTLSIKAIGTKFNTIDSIEDKDGNELQLETVEYEKTAKYELSEDGIYNFTVNYKDSLGNLKTLPIVTQTVNNIDNASPLITLSKNTNEEVESVKITIFAEDERAGVNKIYLINNGTKTELESTTVTGGKQAIHTVGENSTYYFQAEDNLGNISDIVQITISNIVDESNRTYLYNLGDKCTNITGGWAGHKQDNCVIKYNSDSIEMYHTGSSYYNSVVYTTNKINVSNYTKLKIKYEVTKKYTASSNVAMKFGLASTTSDWKLTSETPLNYSKLGTYISEFDITNVTGSYYCKVWRSYDNTGIKIYKVWLE